MRKIESEMVFNVMMGRNWSQANTRVQRFAYSRASLTSGGCDVYLHGHHIATVWNACDGRERWDVVVNKDTLRAWPTRTTMSRLRALGVDVCTRKGEVMLDGVAL